MEFHTILTGYFKLDGGAMFGVVPKSLWQTVNPPDERNLCTWAMRCLLVIHGKNILLIDTGLGDKQDAKFFSHYHPHGTTTLDSEIARLGLTRADITDVLLTHLHFDHVGGAVVRRPDGQLVPSFPNARFHSCARHWDWAIRPNAREKASFLAENILPLEESGQLSFIPRDGRWTRDALGDRFPGLDIFFADGHTESQMIPVLPHPSGTRLAFMPTSSPPVSKMTGLIITRRKSSQLASPFAPSAKGVASATKSRMDSPTCGAARPTPSASYMVSHMF